MAMPNLDPREGGGCLKCMSNKMCSLVVGCLQVVVWILTFFILICNPSLAKGNTAALGVAILICILCITFCALLVLGVYHDRCLYVKTYFIYVIVFMALMIFSLITTIIIEPATFIASFFSILIMILFHLLCFFIVRCYYLMKYKNNRQNNNSNQQSSISFKA